MDNGIAPACCSWKDIYNCIRCSSPCPLQLALHPAAVSTMLRKGAAAKMHTAVAPINALQCLLLRLAEAHEALHGSVHLSWAVCASHYAQASKTSLGSCSVVLISVSRLS